MLEIEEIRDPGEWNRLVAGMEHVSSLQSWGWGEVKRLSGWRVRRLLVSRGGRPLVAAQLLTKGRGPLAISYLPRGPAFGESQELVEGVRALAREAAGVALKLEPPFMLPGEAPPPRLPGLAPAEAVQPEFSLVLRLTSEEEVLARMKPKTRYNIRLSRRKGVTARIVRPGEAGAEEAFESFFALFSETNARARLRQHSKDYYRRVFEAMSQPGGEAFISLAELEGVPLAAGLFVAFGDRVDYLYGGSTRARREVMAPYAMHWEAIRWGLARGLRYYDLWGIPRVPDPESHAYGIYRFKEGFGGKRVRYPAYDLPLGPLYRPARAAIRLRKSLMNWLARGTSRDVL